MMTTPYRAQRSNGACFGTLWKQHTSVTVPSASSWNISSNEDGKKSIGDDKEANLIADTVAANERGKSNEFCVLIGNTLMSFDNLTCFRRGDHPSSEVRIVGASAWNPSNKNSSPNRTSTNSISPTFRLVTNAGTHIYCSAQTVADRDTWLAALHSGLEITYAVFGESLLTLHSKANYMDMDHKRDTLESKDDDEMLFNHATMFKPSIPHPPKSLTTLTSHDTLEPTILSPPKPNHRRIQQLYNRIRTTATTQKINGEASTNPSSPLSASSKKTGSSYSNPYEIYTFGKDVKYHSRNLPLCKVPCASCGRYAPEYAMKLTPSCPLPQYGMENKVLVCSLCLNGQGVLRHISYLTSLYASDVHERLAWAKARDLAFDVVKRICIEQKELVCTSNCGDKYADGIPVEQVTFSWDGTSEQLHNLPSETAQVLTDLIRRSDFAACRRRSQTLDQLCSTWQKDDRAEVGDGVAEFLTSLQENAREAMTSSTGRIKVEKIEMKKEALKVGGDMTATMKMLHEYALPKSVYGVDSSSSAQSPPTDNSEMLACILEFLLDICEEGNLSPIAFFWPQLCQIHMQMLPPTDSESLARVELFEDFLLTVCVKYSVHLSLELVWRCVADLEESLDPTITGSAACQRRRFALLRFVCELESLLFGFDGGWGGGTVSLRGMLIPSDHQEMLIKDTFGILQLHRRCSSHHLTRSVRLAKLQIEIPELSPEVEPHKLASEKSQKDAANYKLQVARNAEYYSSQLMFCRRLGDIAEKLFSLDVDKRAEALRGDLNTLNSSGRMGGDPLNQISDKSGEFLNVMHMPSTEGHVFRSKERTPVLLLLETLRDRNTTHEEDMIQTAENDIQIDRDLDCSSLQNKTLECDKNQLEKHSSNKVQCIDTCINTGQIKCSEVHESCDGNDDVSAHVEDIENIVTNMVNEKLKVSTPIINTKLSESFQSCNEEIINDTQITSTSEGLICEVDDQSATDSNEVHVPESTTEKTKNEVLTTPATQNSMREEGEQPSCTLKEGCVHEPPHSRKVSPMKKSFSSPSFGKYATFVTPSTKTSGGSQVYDRPNLSAHGEERRQVLTTIFLNGMRSSNLIARRVAPAAQRAVQEMDRRRAQLLMGSSERKGSTDECDSSSSVVSADGLASLSGTVQNDIDASSIFAEEDISDMSQPSEEDECMDSLRLLLIQSRVADGKLSPEKAARALQISPSEIGNAQNGKKKVDDAGNIDPRLAGCGHVSDAVLSALKLWKDGLVNNTELLDLVRKDLQYKRLALPGAANETKLMEDSNFWGRFSFGERWAEKKARIQSSSQYGSKCGWDLSGVIVKSNDDLRQEAFCMQLIELCGDIFAASGLELWVQPYRILATGKTTGIIEMVRNAMSFDSLKKRPGYDAGGLMGHFRKMSECRRSKRCFKKRKKEFC